MNNNILTLGTCAGIFHWSSNNCYFGTKEQNDIHRKYYDALRNLYGGKEAENEERVFNYTLNSKGQPVIVLNGLDVVCNDKMIESIKGDFERCEIINNRKWVTFLMVDNKKWKLFDNKWIHSKKFKSLGIDCYDDGLLYYRIHFNNSKFEFICSGGDIYEATEKYTKVTFADVFRKLGVKSDAAKKEIKSIINYIIDFK